MRNLKFIDAKKMLHFGVINLTNQLNDQGINTFISALTRAGQEMGNPLIFPSSVFSHVLMALFWIFLFKGMVFGSALFIKHIKTAELEWYMCEEKKRFPQVQVMFVVINRKGDPAYGNHIFLFIIS